MKGLPDEIKSNRSNEEILLQTTWLILGKTCVMIRMPIKREENNKYQQTKWQHVIEGGKSS